jgi:uncharacterized protein (TIGR02452 family)
VAALNFASARKPGGGVTSGARAQEEDLARASGLYEALLRCPEFYAFHRAHPDPFYSDRIIYAPDVPVFRRDAGSWLPEPLPASFLTSPAPNRRIIERDKPQAVGELPDVLTTRARAILAVAAHHGASHLVLGAWGCGVFGNDPTHVAQAFRTHLNDAMAGAFQHVVFAILDAPSGPTRHAFERAFAAGR